MNEVLGDVSVIKTGIDKQESVNYCEIPPQSGTAFKLSKGQKLQIIDPLGQQVSNLVLFNAYDIREKLCSGKSLGYERKLNLSTGNRIWSSRSRVMVQILEDTNGNNDFLHAPCCPESFKLIYNEYGYRPSCYENLWRNLEKYQIHPDDIPTAFNIFMNVEVGEDGSLSVLPPRSKAGDYLTIKAEMDLIVGLTACSAEQSNNHTFKPIHYRIIK